MWVWVCMYSQTDNLCVCVCVCEGHSGGGHKREHVSMCMCVCTQTDDGGEREVVKKIGEVFPNIGSAVNTQAFVVKPIDLRNLTALVVTTRQRDAIGVSHLKSHL